MIKFWKSAAKGRSGCPVRPPEPAPCTAEVDPALPGAPVMSYTLESISEVPDPFPLTTKKSRLTMDLKDVLSDRKSLSYFVQYMESTSALTLIQFWLDLEGFKCSAAELRNGIVEPRGKLTRTISFESSIKPKVISQERKCITFRKGSCQNVNKNTTESNSTVSDSRDSREPKSSEHYSNEQRLETARFHGETKPMVRNAINLFKKYIALEAPHRLDLPDNIRNIIISNICHPEGLVDMECFKAAQEMALRQLETHFGGFQKSPLYTKAQIDILTNGSLVLDDVLYNEMLLFYFMEYLEQESCSILLEFLMAVMNFSDNLISSGAYDPSEAQDDAIVLYDKYFSLQATSPIGFPTDVRAAVEENICKEGGPLPDCFHTPFRIIHKTLSNYVKSFLDSELYYKYLSEMINSVDKSWTHKKALSDCSSEFSINTQNTLLAMGDPNFKRKRRNHSVPDMTIDSNQLYNADSLWRRKKQDGLSLGRINSLGRFESKFEPDPDKKHTSVFRKMVSKFVHSSTSQVEEEMAWQVAHMIVKDITDLTMAPPEGDT